MAAPMRDRSLDGGHRTKVADPTRAVTAAKADCATTTSTATTNFEYDDNEWDIGIGDLIIDLDADIEKTDEGKTTVTTTPGAAAAAAAAGRQGGPPPPMASAAAAGTPAKGKLAIEHSATVDKGLKMKIKRTKPGTKTSEAKHEIVKSNEQNGDKHATAAAAQAAAAAAAAAAKRGSGGHRRDKQRDKHEPQPAVNGALPRPPVQRVVFPVSAPGPGPPPNAPGPPPPGPAAAEPAPPAASALPPTPPPPPPPPGPSLPPESAPPTPPAAQQAPASPAPPSPPKRAKTAPVACPSDISKEVVDACIGTSVGTITEPDCLGPCEPGTSVTLEGIVWHETEGVLVVNVTWRGKTYVGTLLDCSRHDTWAPPRFCDSPTSDLDARTPKGRGKRGRQATGAAAASDLSNFTETRSSVHSKLRSNNNGGAKGRRQPGGPGSPTPFAPPPPAKPETPGKRKPGKAPEEETPAKKAKAPPAPPPPPAPAPAPVPVAPAPIVVAPPTSPPPSPVLLECPEPNCSKKYKHANGLKYHQSHAHGGEDDETKESAGSLSEPDEAASPAAARKESAPATPAEAPAPEAPPTPMEVAEPSPVTPALPTPATPATPVPEEPPVTPSTPDKSVIKPSVLRFGNQEESLLTVPTAPPVSRPSQTAPLQPASPRQPSPAPVLPSSLPPNLTPNVAPALAPSLAPVGAGLTTGLAPGLAPNLSPGLGAGLARDLGPNPGPIQLVIQPPHQMQPSGPAHVVQIAPSLVHQGPAINAKVPQFKVKPTSVLMPDEKKAAAAVAVSTVAAVKPPSHKKKSRKSPAGSPHPHPHLVDPQPLGLESSGREDVQSPAYSDISDDGAPVLDPEVDGSKSKPVVGDKKEANPGQSPHSVQHFYSSYYGQPPYLVPSVTADKPKEVAGDKGPEAKPGMDKEKKDNPNVPSEFPQKMLQQHYYPYQYVPGYPYNIDTGYSVPMVAEDKQTGIKDEKSPGLENPKQNLPPAPVVAHTAMPAVAKIKAEPGAKEKHNDNHQILKESKDVINQMSPGYFYPRPQPQPQPPTLQQQQQEEMRKYLIYENRRREQHQAASEGPIGLKATPPPQHKHPTAAVGVKKEKEDKKEDKKQEGVKPTMETQGPPPPPTSQYAYIHPGYMQSPHYGPIPFDPGHPVYARSINPMIVPGPYQQSPYMHPQLHPPMGRPYHAAEDLSRPQSGPKALDLLQHHASQYYTSHKIHELQERAMKSPTPAKAAAATPSPGERPPTGGPAPQGPPGAPQGPPQAPPAAAGKPPSADGKDSRSPPPQRHVHTHHHTHVGLGYPILTGQYPAPFGGKPL